MAGLSVDYNERHEAALHAWGLVECLPCGGTGHVLSWSGRPLSSVFLSSDVALLASPEITRSKCTLCKGKGITHPPPTTTIGWHNPRSYWDIDPPPEDSRP